MSRWVTFHYDLLNERVADLKVHQNKQDALKCFNKQCKNFFEVNTRFVAKELPATYGYPLRKYYGISAQAFKKMFEISIDEALKIAK